MATRLPELSYRLAHHLPDALPFIVPFYNKLVNAGFQIDERKLKPVLRRNGIRIVTDYAAKSDQTIVTFRLYGDKASIASVDLKLLRKRIESVSRVKDYAAVDTEINGLVNQLMDATAG